MTSSVLDVVTQSLIKERDQDVAKKLRLELHRLLLRSTVKPNNNYYSHYMNKKNEKSETDQDAK